MLDRGANINARDSRKRTPVFLACTSGHPQAARALVRAGADVNISNDTDMSPLHIALQNGRRETTFILLRNGADVHTVSRQQQFDFGMMLLQLATRWDMPEVTNRLLTHGASPRQTRRQPNKSTSVHLTAQNGQLETLDVLLEHWRGGVDARCENGDTPLH
jgi:ankyrin repeat protein